MTIAKFRILPLVCGITATVCLSASAVPLLQLDIGGGTYDTASKDVVTGDRSFTLYALADLFKNNGKSNFAADQTFYLSISFPGVTQSTPAPGLGNFTVTSGGSTLPMGALNFGQPSSLKQSHGVFPAYYYEYAFTTFPDQSASYNVEDNSGGPQPGTGLNFRAFEFDMAGLAPGLSAHFDLYSDGQPFAPFSHDASASFNGQNQVPDGGTTLVLFGLTLLGLVGSRKLIGTQG